MVDDAVATLVCAGTPVVVEIELDAVFGFDSAGLIGGAASGFGVAVGLPAGFNGGGAAGFDVGVAALLLESAAFAGGTLEGAGLAVLDGIELDVVGFDVIELGVAEFAVADAGGAVDADAGLLLDAVASGVAEGGLVFAIAALSFGAGAGLCAFSCIAVFAEGWLGMVLLEFALALCAGGGVPAFIAASLSGGLVSAVLPCADVAAAVESFVCVFADAGGTLEGRLPAVDSLLDTLSADGGLTVGCGAVADDSLYGGLLPAEPLLETLSADGGFIVGCGTGRESTVASVSSFEPCCGPVRVSFGAFVGVLEVPFAPAASVPPWLYGRFGFVAGDCAGGGVADWSPVAAVWSV